MFSTIVDAAAHRNISPESCGLGAKVYHAAEPLRAYKHNSAKIVTNFPERSSAW
jgi:hypothetical protein